MASYRRRLSVEILPLQSLPLVSRQLHWVSSWALTGTKQNWATPGSTCCCLLLGSQSHGHAQPALSSIPTPCTALGAAGLCHSSMGLTRGCCALQKVLMMLGASARGLCSCLPPTLSCMGWHRRRAGLVGPEARSQEYASMVKATFAQCLDHYCGRGLPTHFLHPMTSAKHS